MSTEDLYKLYCECGYQVSTDSRTIPAGAIFFALRGENFDGNEYALKALEAGASYAVVNADAWPAARSKGPVCGPQGAASTGIASPKANAAIDLQHTPVRVPDSRLIPVEDPFQALQALAIHHRKVLGIPVIGLTGTNGKTTTKELIAAALGAKFKVAATK